MSENLTDKLPKTDGEKLNLILTTVQKLEGRFDNLELRVNGIDSRLDHVEGAMEQKLHDTRPIWHRVVADIAQLQAGQNRLEEGQAHLRGQMLEMYSTVRDVNRDQIVINDSLRRIQMDLHTIDERLYKIELNRCQRNSST